MKLRLLALFFLASLASCSSPRYDPLPEPLPAPPPIPAPSPSPSPLPPAPPTPKPSPEDKTGALPAERFRSLENGITLRQIELDLGKGEPGAGNPDGNGLWWFIWHKVDCGGPVLLDAQLPFLKLDPNQGSTPDNLVYRKDRAEICR